MYCFPNGRVRHDGGWYVKVLHVWSAFADQSHVDAIDKIASVRSVVSPIEFFIHQLELYERCEMDPDPSKYPEYRRFLMNYMAQDMLGMQNNQVYYE
jgi:hypothetical protein